MKVDGRALAAGLLAGLLLSAVSWAFTVDQIWSNVYDSVNHAIRLNVVAS